MRISYLRTTAWVINTRRRAESRHCLQRLCRGLRRVKPAPPPPAPGPGCAEVPHPAPRTAASRGTRGGGGTCGRRGARRGRPPRRHQPSVGPSVRPSVRPRERGERRWRGTRCWVTPARPRRRRGASGCRGAAPAAAQPTVCRAGDFSREIFGGSAGSGAGGQRVFGSESESAEGASLPKGPINPSAAPSRPGKAPASARPAPRSLRPRVRRPPRLAQPRDPTQPRWRPGSPARPGPAGAGAPDTGPASRRAPAWI